MHIVPNTALKAKLAPTSYSAVELGDWTIDSTYLQPVTYTGYK
jgi:hypothetical protein